MTLYAVGNLLGRLLLSYLIVWLVSLVFARGDWRAAFRRTTRWYSILGVLILFVLGVGATYRTGGFSP
jgi:hypothetical protein